jgi:hypothetical protein
MLLSETGTPRQMEQNRQQQLDLGSAVGAVASCTNKTGLVCKAFGRK